MFNLTYSTSKNSNSSPFYNYTLNVDTLYVGDDGGVLWKITGVFSGTPAKATGNWASGITVHSGATLTGPVWDPGSNNIFVGDSTGLLWYVMDTGSTTGTCTSSHVVPCLGSTDVDATNGQGSGDPVKDPPLVDSASQKVFVFNSGSGTSGTAYVTQATTALGSLVHAAVGDGSASNNVHDGAFDNNYYNGTYTSGHLYVCGQPDRNEYPELFSITFGSTGTMSSSSTAGPNLGTAPSGGAAGQECSPLTEIYNTGTSTDWLFLGVTEYCVPSGSSGCVMSWNITSGPPSSGASPTHNVTEPGGTSAIIIDDVSSQNQASSLYFSTLGAETCGTPGGGNVSGCSVKLTQSGLQ
jgi:hypothetical protein